MGFQVTAEGRWGQGAGAAAGLAQGCAGAGLALDQALPVQVHQGWGLVVLAVVAALGDSQWAQREPQVAAA